MDSEGRVQYVVVTPRLNLTEEGSVLWAPRRQLCGKLCAKAPLFSLVWFDWLFGWLKEARCPADGSRLAGGSEHEINIKEGFVWQYLLGLLSPGFVRWLEAYQFQQRVCRQREPRHEPIAHFHRRRQQSNLYYSFSVLMLGAKNCCCY